MPAAIHDLTPIRWWWLLLIALKLAAAGPIPCQAAELDPTNSAPVLEFTTVPGIGSSDLLQGRALNVPPSSYRVAVFIYAFGWWTKPSWAAPLTSIRPDGTWTCDVVTGGSDACASRIAAYLLPATYAPPLLEGQSEIPLDLEQRAVAKQVVNRQPATRTLHFGGYDWSVKSTGNCQWGPGPNYYSDSTNNVWLDASGRMHLRLTHRDNQWQCAEVALQQSLGYGAYRFLLASPVDRFDRNVVFGLFTWSDDSAFAHREIDIEFSVWSDPNNPGNAQFVVQPFNDPGHLMAFREPVGIATSTHSFSWEPDRVGFLSLRGLEPYTGVTSRIIREWTFTRSGEVPPPGDETARMNLWLFNGVPPADGREVEVVIEGFEFTPSSPKLDIARTGAGMAIRWPAGYSAFSLEQSATAGGNWTAVTESPILAGANLQVTLPAPERTLFLRLRK